MDHIVKTFAARSVSAYVVLRIRDSGSCFDAVQKANSGHPGMPMGMADVATVLFKNHLKFDPNDPKWIDRDRFILSNGHGSMPRRSKARRP